jgi:hypothetical protein
MQYEAYRKRIDSLCEMKEAGHKMPSDDSAWEEIEPMVAKFVQERDRGTP